MKDEEVLLDVRNLKMHFPFSDGSFWNRKNGSIYAVDGVSFTLKKGETIGLVGESGCGKSTIARAIAQLHKPTEGEVIFRGKDLTKIPKHEMLESRQYMQMVFQDPYASLNPRMTAGDIIAEPMKIFRNRGLGTYTKDEINERVEHLMERVGLSRFFRNRYPHEFSGGQRQRIGIARALALKPELLLCDEPVSALDVSIQAQILNLFKAVQEEFGLTYLFIAHDLSVIKYISDRVAVMYLGRIAELSDAKLLYAKPLHPYTEALLSAAPIPDPVIERKRKRIILQGDPPSPDQKRVGCYFYDRCAKRKPCCVDNIPELREVESGHQVACFLYFDPK